MSKKNIETYKNENGEIAILVSGGYGAGWSTWGKKELAYDKRVVEFWLSKKDDEAFLRDVDSGRKCACLTEAKEYFESIGYPGVYFGGFSDIHIEWIAPGTPFIIHEYDGYETIDTDYEGYTVL